MLIIKLSELMITCLAECYSFCFDNNRACQAIAETLVALGK